MTNMEIPRPGADLPEATRRIAENGAHRLRLMAGPGTGKTYTMMKRVAWFLDCGVASERILICTFTRTAATDLGRELLDLGVEGAGSILATTIHSFCMRVLMQSGALEMTGRSPRTLLDYEETFLIEDLGAERFGGIRQRQERLRAFNAAWARLQSDEPGWPHDLLDHAFGQALIAWLRFHGAMLIGELVPETLKYFRNNPTTPELARYTHILVDEYQDLNKAEQTLLDLIAENSDLTVVGDEDQSIYSFKFAHPDGIRTFPDRHADTWDESLDICRRCPAQIVSMANHLISQNPGRTSRVLRAHPQSEAGEVLIVQWDTMQDEAAGIAALIAERVESGNVEPGGVLVLAPRRLVGYGIRDALVKLGIQADSFFQEEMLEGNPRLRADCQAPRMFSLLRLLANSEDRVALRCWCGLGSTSLRSTAWGRLRSHCETTGNAPYGVLTDVADGKLNLTGISSLMQPFRELQNLLARLNDVTSEELVNLLFPEGELWASALRSAALRLGAVDFTASELLEWLLAAVNRQEAPLRATYVRVMSLHKAKGLTADLVIVAGCVEGMIPRDESSASIAEKERALQEQRRLFYVAVTRARRTLVISSFMQLRQRDAHRMMSLVRPGSTGARTQTSRFVNELGPNSPIAVRGDTLLGVSPALDTS